MEQNSTPEVIIPKEETTQTPNSDSSNPKDNHWITILSMALFVLLSLGAVAFLYYQNQKLKSMLASYQTPAVSPTPAATTDPTANWSTYTNSSLAFSFKYPADWGTPKESITKSQSKINFEDKLVVTFLQAQTLEEYTAKNLPTDNTPPYDYISGDIKGKRFVYKSGVDQTIIDTVIAFPGPKESVITVSYRDSPGHITSSETIDQIISTFKFMEASPSAQPKACTQEAKLCPDGTSVGRSGPNCEFAPCPTP